MRSISTRLSVRKRVLATALAAVALLVGGSVAPALGIPDPPAKALKVAQQALRIAKRANRNSAHSLSIVRRAGPTGPHGPRGSEGLDGRQGADGQAGPLGPTGPAGPQGLTGVTGPNGINGTSGATGPTGPRGLQGAPGSARAFATVRPDTPSVVASRSAGVTGVNRPADDHYCVSVADIDVTATSPVVSIDLGLSTGSLASLFAAVDSTGTGCAAGQIAVVTAGAVPNSAAFTILVP
jgi:Collagen triple helix repeat (20 copies)